MPTGLGDEQLWLCPTLDNATPFNDLSGQANNGTAVGGLSTIADTSNGGAFAYDFDGTDDYIDCGNILGGTTGGQDDAVTYSSWMKLDSYANNINGFGTGWMGKCDNTSHGGPVLNNLNGVISFSRFPYLSTGGNSLGTTSDASQVPTGTWKHVAVTYSGCETTGCTAIYVDGVAVSATDAITNYGSGMPTNTDSFKIGTTLDAMAFKRMMNGQMDDIRVYGRVLSQAEITHLAEARGIEGPPPVGLGDEKLWLCPSLNDSANDISGNGNNGVYQGGMGTIADTSNGGSLAYDFDGAGDYISNSSLSLAGLTEFSFSGWIYASGSPDLRGIFSHGENTDYNNDIYILNNHGNFNAEVNNGVGGNGSVAKVAQNTWNHISVVFDGSGATNADRLRYFVNGVEVTLTYNYTVPSSTSSASPAHIEIGAFATFGGVHLWFGKMDDIRVFTRAITQSEITHLAEARGIEGPPPVGLGGETMWICPSLNQTSTTTELTGAGLTITEAKTGTATIAIVADTAQGGTHALEFVRDTSYCVLAVDNFGNTYGEITTIAFWVKTVPNGSSNIRLMGLNTNFWPTVFNGRFFYETWVGAARGYMIDPSGGTNGWHDTADVTSWTHITMVREGTGGKKRLYYNGVLDNQEYDDAGWVTSGNDLYLGIGGGSSNVVGSKAYLDDMRTYGRAITQSEITHLATSRGIEGSPSTPTAQHNAFATHAFKQLFQQRLR